jgi:hypothetical protein
MLNANLGISEMQIKTITRYHLTQLEWIYQKDKINVGEYAEKEDI